MLAMLPLPSMLLLGILLGTLITLALQALLRPHQDESQLLAHRARLYEIRQEMHRPYVSPIAVPSRLRALQQRRSEPGTVTYITTFPQQRRRA